MKICLFNSEIQRLICISDPKQNKSLLWRFQAKMTSIRNRDGYVINITRVNNTGSFQERNEIKAHNPGYISATIFHEIEQK